jgi:hypothetical protein
MAAAKPGAWMLKGKVLIACNCDFGCPCNVNGMPTHGECEGGWTWCIEQGAVGEVRLDGLNFGLYCDWPGAIHQGDGVAVSMIDERADPAQREALSALLEGGLGGPWAIFRATFKEVHGPRFVSFAVESAAELPRASVGGAVTLDYGYISNPVTGETIHPRLSLPEGLVVKEAALVATGTFKVEDEAVSYDHSGRYGAFGHFQYFGP